MRREGEGWVADDPVRLAAVRRARPTGESLRALERLAELAIRLLGAGAAQVSLLGEDQVAVAGAGLEPGAVGRATPLEESLCALAAQTAPDALVVVDARRDPRVAHLGPVQRGEIGAYLGIPLATADGMVIGALCLHQPEPREWTGTEVFLVAQLADSVSSELELTALSAEFETRRLRTDLAAEAAGIGSFEHDLRTGRLTWDEPMARLFGQSATGPDLTFEGFLALLHPEDRAATTAVIGAAVEACGPFRCEYRVQLPPGRVRWLAARGRAVGDAGGTAVRVLGAAFDVTVQREGDTRVSRVLEAMSAAFYSLDHEWRFTYVNAEAERLLARPREELLGGVLWELFPAALDSPFEVHYRRSAATGEPTAFQAHYPAPLAGWYEMRVSPGPDGLSVYFLEVTERRRAEEQARRSAERLALIAEVTASFGGALDGGTDALERALARLAQSVAPGLADFSIVSVVDLDGRLRDVASWHADPASRALVAEYARLRLPGLTSSAPLVRAMRTGRVVTIEDVGRQVGELFPTAAAITLVFQALAPSTAVVLPLVARGRTVGALTLYRGSSRPAVGADDLATAVEVADRAALALDNARLYEQQRRMSEEMQRSLLTAPPQPAGLQIAVRYQPAVEAAQVGGDWYDAFVQPDGATMVVIGDVVGHDSAAAAAMGQLRGLLRGIAYRRGAGPAAVLGDLDRAMEGLGVRTMATAAIARLERTADEEQRGEARLRWSAAGHPPVMVRHADGRVDVLAADRPDLMLGVDPRVARTESELLLGRGATVLLYTDGLVEGRDLPYDTGLEQLSRTLGELGTARPDELCDQVVARLRPVGPQDDIALLAVRLGGAPG